MCVRVSVSYCAIILLYSIKCSLCLNFSVTVTVWQRLIFFLFSLFELNWINIAIRRASMCVLVPVFCLLTNYPKESNVKYLTATNSISVHTRTHQVHWQAATEVFFEIDQQQWQQRTNRHLHKLVRTPVHTQFFVTWRNVACNWSTCVRNVFWQAIHSNWLKEENEQNGNEEIKKREKVKYDEESSLNNDEDKKMEKNILSGNLIGIHAYEWQINYVFMTVAGS